MSAAEVAGDISPIEVAAPSRTRTVTTLYDLIAALNDSIAPGEEELVTAAVVHVLNSGRVKYFGKPLRCDRPVPEEVQGALLLG